MNSPEPLFSFVIPVFESELNLSALVERLNGLASSKMAPAFHVIFIDDASRDNSLQKLTNLTKEFSHEIHTFHQNQGQFTATAYGLGQVQTALAITIDDDLQHDPIEALELLKHYDQTQSALIYGDYDKKQHPLPRKLGAAILRRLLQLTGTNYNGVSSFRLIDHRLLKQFKGLDRKVVFLDFELRQMAPSIAFLTVQHHPRKETKSSYSALKLIKLSLTLIFVHTGAPLKWMSRLGLIIALICFGFGIYFLIQKVYYDVPIGYTSIIVSTLFSSGLVLFSLGIIGEYIRKIWLQGAQIKTLYARKIED
jgi:undecaprenyl-phosphate 4-deoxy-4-formamido-L-arabinose transferase